MEHPLLLSHLVWFLLPVAAWSGWWMARRNHGSAGHRRHQVIHPEYFKGLNYVLNEQPDKAIEVFIRMLEVDSETVETHLALGNLYRRRGEVDRAIRIHQNLIARPALERDQRDLALLELGLDYMRSGLLDRAESLFKELVGSGPYQVRALRALLDIYQQEKDWDGCIETAQRLEHNSGDSLADRIAQFYCEQADGLRGRGQIKPAADCVRRALDIAPDCVRASMIDAELAFAGDDFHRAVRAYRRVEKQDPDYLPEIIVPLLECYRRLNRVDEGMRWLRDIVDRYGGVTATLALTGLIARHEGEDAAADFIAGELRKRPSVRGLERLLEYTLVRSDGITRERLITLRELIGKLLEDRPVYQCTQCGFTGQALYWQCPGCKHWNTVKPIHGVEGE